MTNKWAIFSQVISDAPLSNMLCTLMRDIAKVFFLLFWTVHLQYRRPYEVDRENTVKDQLWHFYKNYIERRRVGGRYFAINFSELLTKNIYKRIHTYILEQSALFIRKHNCTAFHLLESSSGSVVKKHIKLKKAVCV